MPFLSIRRRTRRLGRAFKGILRTRRLRAKLPIVALTLCAVMLATPLFRHPLVIAAAPPHQDFADDSRLKRLVPDADVWIDPHRRRVVLRGKVCLREGPLELLACLENTKEHEAIVSVRSKAFLIHTALLAVGAKPGNPAAFFPEYRPATGPTIDITVYWTDAKGKRHQNPAKDWVRNAESGEALAQDWVFGGSGFWRDEESGQEFYLAEDGDVICVSNFPSAMLDLPVESSQSNEALLYEAFTEHIPPLDTQVAIVLTPRKPPRNQQPPDDKAAE